MIIVSAWSKVCTEVGVGVMLTAMRIYVMTNLLYDQIKKLFYSFFTNLFIYSPILVKAPSGHASTEYTKPNESKIIIAI